MNTKRLGRLAICLCAMAATALADSPATGPAVTAFGPAFDVPGDSYNLLSGQAYKVSWDVGQGPEDPAQPNRSIESVARFINMHARHGIDVKDLELAVVLHGAGARAALGDAAHRTHFGVGNGSAELLQALGAQGVKFYLCGQTAGHYGYREQDLLPEVRMAVSAMTAHVRLQAEGYALIPF